MSAVNKLADGFMFEHGKHPANTRSIQILVSAPCKFKTQGSV